MKKVVSKRCSWVGVLIQRSHGLLRSARSFRSRSRRTCDQVISLENSRDRVVRQSDCGAATSSRSTSSASRMPVAAKANSWPDRKSTRLNSSHVSISYAVFCLKKKKNERHLKLLTT